MWPSGSGDMPGWQHSRKQGTAVQGTAGSGSWKAAEDGTATAGNPPCSSWKDGSGQDDDRRARTHGRSDQCKGCVARCWSVNIR